MTAAEDALLAGLDRVDEAARLLGTGRPGAPQAAFREATVQSVAANQLTVGISYAGSAVVILGVPCLGWYSPVVGDDVWVAQSGASLLVLGTKRSGGMLGTVPGGYVENASFSITAVGGAETVVPIYATVTLIAGRRYRVTGYGRVQAAAGPATIGVIIRSSGSAALPTTSSAMVSTSDMRIDVNAGAGAETNITMRPFVAAATGVTVLAMTIKRTAGAGDVLMTQGNSYGWLHVEDVGI
jgi:hypothetical protein